MNADDYSTPEHGIGKHIAAALCAAQPEIESAILNKENPHFHSRYADLLSVRRAVLPVYAKHGLTVSQVCRRIEGAHYIETILIHTSGETLSSLWPIIVERPGPHQFGSACTYARRYGLSAIALVACEDDDDANAANAAPVKTKPAPKQPAARPVVVQKPEPDRGDPFDLAEAEV